MKDPAILFYYDTWLTATAEMDADVSTWYLNLLIHNYDKSSLPNNIETLASLARVKFSEFERFKQVFEQVLKQKFEQTPDGRLNNPVTNEILRKRELYLNKRSDAGKLSYILKYYRSKYKITKEFENFIKTKIDVNIDIKNEQVLKQVFEHLSELYKMEMEMEMKMEGKGGWGKNNLKLVKLKLVKLEAEAPA